MWSQPSYLSWLLICSKLDLYYQVSQIDSTGNIWLSYTKSSESSCWWLPIISHSSDLYCQVFQTDIIGHYANIHLSSSEQSESSCWWLPIVSHNSDLYCQVCQTDIIGHHANIHLSSTNIQSDSSCSWSAANLTLLWSTALLKVTIVGNLVVMMTFTQNCQDEMKVIALMASANWLWRVVLLTAVLSHFEAVPHVNYWQKWFL